MATSTFNRVKGLHPRRSRFNLTYGKAFDCDMGQLIPTMTRFMAPGDIFTFHQEAVVRTKGPLRSPAFAELNVFSYNFFVPLRILFGETITDSDGNKEWEIHDHDFEKFITGGVNGTDTSVVLPRWIPTGGSVVNDNWNGIDPPDPGDPDNGSNKNDVNVTVTDNGIYSLWDYLGYPIDVVPSGAYPLDFKRRAYNLIYNEWFVDRNCMPLLDVEYNDKVMQATWKKDFFTSMLPWQQRGSAPFLPIRGILPITFKTIGGNLSKVDSPSIYTNLLPLQSDPSLLQVTNASVSSIADGTFSTNPNYAGVKGSVDLQDAAKIYINDLRVAFQIQRWMELSARIGSRYVEFLKGMYGVSPTDDTLQRPMFIGGSKSPVIITEVLQTGASGNDGVGSMKGHSISADRSFLGRFRANEFGLMMTLSVIRPKAMYHQGIEMEDLYENRYQFLNPAFVSLSEEGVPIASLYAQNSGNVDANGDPVIIGFQGRYNELRTGLNQVCGALRGGQNMSYWAMTRTFGAKPVLNQMFLKCIPDKSIFSVLDEPAFVCYFNNRITAYRPLPVDAQPGYIDHLYGER